MEYYLENPLPTTNDKFASLFDIENEHMPSKAYTQKLNDSDGFYRSIRSGVVSSIVIYSRNFDPFMAYLAINYMDRFLSTRSIPDGKTWIFKLVAICCISLALKMRKTEFSVFELMRDGRFMFDLATIQRMEMVILGALNWRMRSVNPFCFSDYFVAFLKNEDKPSIQALKNRATMIILKAQDDIKLLEFKPSVISASALLCATDDLFPVQFPSFRNSICSCSYVNKEDFLQCYDMMQDVAIECYKPVWAMASSSCTPANVLDANCFSSSISGSQSNQTTETEDNEGGNQGL